MKIVIVMPAWNEEGNIRRMVDELLSNIFPKIDADMHLLVVGNKSKDKTDELATDASKKSDKIHFMQQGAKSGLGWAFIEGYKYAINTLHADGILEMDADFQHPPRFIKPMVDAFLAGADYCIGSRYIKGGSVPKEWPLFRKAVSYFGNLFIRLCLLNFKIHDLTTGFRLTRVEGVLDKIDLNNLMEPTRFAHKTDLLYRTIKLTKKVVEIPLEFAQRTEEQSKFNPKEMIASFKVAIILGIKDKIKLIKFGTVGFTGFMVNFILLRVCRNAGLPEVMAWFISTEVAIINNYIFNNIWTFKEAKIAGLKNTIIKFGQFNLTSGGALAIQSVFGPLGVKLIGVRYDWLVLALVVVFLILPYNYTMYNLVIWKTWKNPFAKKNKA